jgi:hypothetical protein
MLAVLEHLQESDHETAAAAIAARLRGGGRLVITVPEPVVDRIVDVLARMRIVDGMALREHHGFVAETTPRIFEPHGLRLLHHRRFQVGLKP